MQFDILDGKKFLYISTYTFKSVYTNSRQLYLGFTPLKRALIISRIRKNTPNITITNHSSYFRILQIYFRLFELSKIILKQKIKIGNQFWHETQIISKIIQSHINTKAILLTQQLCISMSTIFYKFLILQYIYHIIEATNGGPLKINIHQVKPFENFNCD